MNYESSLACTQLASTAEEVQWLYSLVTRSSAASALGDDHVLLCLLHPQPQSGVEEAEAQQHHQRTTSDLEALILFLINRKNTTYDRALAGRVLGLAAVAPALAGFSRDHGGLDNGVITHGMRRSLNDDEETTLLHLSDLRRRTHTRLGIHADVISQALVELLNVCQELPSNSDTQRIYVNCAILLSMIMTMMLTEEEEHRESGFRRKTAVAFDSELLYLHPGMPSEVETRDALMTSTFERGKLKFMNAGRRRDRAVKVDPIAHPHEVP